METLQALQQEAAVMKQQIDEARAAAQEVGETGKPTSTALLARERLDKLEDNYRQVLNSIATVSQVRPAPSPLGDKVRIDINGNPIPAGDTTTRVVKVYDPATGQYTDWPDPSATATKPTPTAADQLERIYDPNNPSRVIKLRDPATNTTIDVPDVAAGGKPTVVSGAGGAVYSWDGAKLTPLIAATPDKPQIIQNQSTGAIYSWDGKSLTTHNAGKPQPTEGQERSNVKDGYHVTEKFVGGEWTTVAYGDPAKPGQPTEGQTRPNTKEGYKVTETYSGGEWTVTDVGERATPRESTTLSAPSDQRYIVRTDAEGKPVTVENPNWQPKTTGDVAARVGQLQTLAQQKKDEVMKKVSGTYTADQALAEFNTWWDQNVEPQTAALRAAGEEAQFQRGKELAGMRTSAQTAALGAGTLAQRAIEDQQKRTVSGDFLGEMGKVWNATAQGQAAGPIDYTKLARPDRDVAGEAARATAEALKYIDPMAAQMTGTGQPSWMTMNPADALNRTSYTSGLGGGPATAPVIAPVTDPLAGLPAPGTAPNLFHATPIITTPEGENQWSYQMEAANAARDAQQAQVTADLEALINQPQEEIAPYVPPVALAPRPAPRPVVRRPVPTAVNQMPFNQQALAAGLGAGGLGPERYVPPTYQYGGQYAMPVPY